MDAHMIKTNIDMYTILSDRVYSNCSIKCKVTYMEKRKGKEGNERQRSGKEAEKKSIKLCAPSLHKKINENFPASLIHPQVFLHQCNKFIPMKS